MLLITAATLQTSSGLILKIHFTPEKAETERELLPPGLGVWRVRAMTAFRAVYRSPRIQSWGPSRGLLVETKSVLYPRIRVIMQLSDVYSVEGGVELRTTAEGL